MQMWLTKPKKTAVLRLHDDDKVGNKKCLYELDTFVAANAKEKFDARLRKGSVKSIRTGKLVRVIL